MDSSLAKSLADLVPIIFGTVGILQTSICKSDSARWNLALGASFVTLVLSLWGLTDSLFAQGVQPELVHLLTMALITGLATVLCKFSKNYLRSLKRQAEFATSLLLTLAAVSTIVATQHLGVLVIAWAASSFFLHGLLTFFNERPLAHLAAQKKFIVSRCAELCLIGFLMLIQWEFGSLDMSEISLQLGHGNWSDKNTVLQAAAVLLSLAVILKSAQFPLHGWLLQVMEAPTPVSALLHAGVVNVGGYVLIRMASMISAVPAAQILLVVVGGTTALVAGLVTLTRVSIKVRLAWSTCAQMGFMLVECGLGLYELAFVHLISHSLYKAHAFLSCGDTVYKTVKSKMAPASQDVGFFQTVFAAICGVGLFWTAAYFWAQLRHGEQVNFAFFVIPGLALAPLLGPLLQAFQEQQWRAWVVSLSQALFVIGVTLVVHFEAHPFLLLPEASSSVQDWLIFGVAAAFVVLFVLQGIIAAFPAGRLARKIYPWIYGGFFVDELFSVFAAGLRLPRKKPQTGEMSGRQATENAPQGI